jgi:hypothetical protein
VTAGSKQQPDLRSVTSFLRIYPLRRGSSHTMQDNDATNADQPPVFVLHSDHGSIRGNPISHESTTQAGIAATRLAQSGFGCSACGALPVVRVRQVQVTGLRKLSSRENRVSPSSTHRTFWPVELAQNPTSREEELLAASDRAESLYYQLHGGYARKRGFARFRQAVRL